MNIAMQLAKKMQNLYIYNEVNIFYIMYSLLHCFFQKVTFSQNGTWSRTLRALCALQKTNPIHILGVFHYLCIYPNKKMYLFFVVFLTGTLIHFASIFHEKNVNKAFRMGQMGLSKNLNNLSEISGPAFIILWKFATTFDRLSRLNLNIQDRFLKLHLNTKILFKKKSWVKFVCRLASK